MIDFSTKDLKIMLEIGKVLAEAGQEYCEGKPEITDAHNLLTITMLLISAARSIGASKEFVLKMIESSPLWEMPVPKDFTFPPKEC